MHVDKKFFSFLIDESDFAQHDFHLMFCDARLRPAIFQLFDPRSGKPSLYFKRDPLGIAMSRDFEHIERQKVFSLNRLSIHDRHKIPLKLLLALDQRTIHCDSLNTEAIKPADRDEFAIAVV